MKTTKELMVAIGQTASLRTNKKFCVDVLVLDVRTVWNRIDCLVRPIAGDGELWVSCDRLIINRAPSSEIVPCRIQ